MKTLLVAVGIIFFSLLSGLIIAIRKAFKEEKGVFDDISCPKNVRLFHEEGEDAGN